MQLCSEYHDEVAYETSRCPVCEAIDELDEEIRNLEFQVEDLEGKLDKLIPIVKQYKPEALV